MFISQIEFKIPKSFDRKDEQHEIYGFLATLLHDGRIGKNSHVLFDEKLITASVEIPDTDAFDNLEANQYLPKAIDRLKVVNISSPKFKIIGKALDFIEVCSCKNSSAYILHSSYASSSISPIHCFDCFNSIPLYRLPRFDSGDFFNVYIWQRDYISCDSLQMHCQTGERFGLREMSLPNSSLTKIGLGICSKIEELTGKSCYYFLYRYRGNSLKTERERKCPKCHGEWLLSESLHRLFDFKCDECRLLGNIADSLR
jgi:predicted  nucleic acid-binding Zn ribbon protein